MIGYFATFALLAVRCAGFTGNVTKSTAFGTGHLFDLGSCAAVTTQIGAKCFEDMPERIAPFLSPGLSGNVTCVTHIERSPCNYGTMKYSVRSEGYDCDALHILYADANEECLRKYYDARFWACMAYIVAITICAGLVCAFFAAICGMLR